MPTLAIVVSDAVNSTLLNSTVGDAKMIPIWARHDQKVRELIQTCDGQEVARSDGFLVLFQTVDAAVTFAVAYHRLMASIRPLQVRIGIHLGEISLRDNSELDRARGAPLTELDGVAVPVAARVMSIASGNQTLLSDAAKLGAPQLPKALTQGVVSHGFWRFKGILNAMEIFEVGGPDCPFVPPADGEKAYRVIQHNGHWVPSREVRHSLPSERDVFVGREASLRRLSEELRAGTRLVTLTGTGGMGKTRLATHFGWRWIGEFPGGVWFCDLSPARSVDGIAHAVAKGLELPLEGGDPVRQIGRALASRRQALVILDNFEQVVEHVGETLEVWLDSASEIQFVVTSRSVLGLAGETVLDVPPLDQADSEVMFMRRASAASSSIQDSTDDNAAVKPLVALLDGLPLAIELTAARTRLMNPRMLLQRMSERFLLTSPPNSRGSRQSTLRSTFAWSWELLSPVEQSTLAQLSVFQGGFTLDAAERVIEYPEGVWPADVIQSLFEKSFVRRTGAVRLGLLNSIRAYCAEQLSSPGSYPGSGPIASASANERHWQFFAAFDEREALQDNCAEVENLIVACRRATAVPDPHSAADCLESAWFALRICGPFRVAFDLGNAIEKLPGLNRLDQARLDLIIGRAAMLTGDLDTARRRIEAGAAKLPKLQDSLMAGRFMCAMGDLHLSIGNLGEAEAAFEQVIRSADGDGRETLRYPALNGLGDLALQRADLPTARKRYESALFLAEARRDDRWIGGLLSNLGAVAYSEGRLSEAANLYERALALGQSIGDRRWAGAARCNLALLKYQLGLSEEAKEQFAVALASARALGHAQLEGAVLCNLGIVHESCGDLDHARECHEEAIQIARGFKSRRAEGQFRGYLGLVFAKLGRMEDARSCLAIGESYLRAGADKLSLGLFLTLLAQSEYIGGQTLAAQSALAEAESIASTLAASSESELGRALIRSRRFTSDVGHDRITRHR